MGSTFVITQKFLPWELGKPRKVLKELVESGQVVLGRTLDLCCEARTNPVYLTKNGFDVTALDISEKAVEYARGKASAKSGGLNLVVGSFLKIPFVTTNIADLEFFFNTFLYHTQIQYLSYNYSSIP
jgi:SAM-dependent methyltransferase